MYPSNKKKKIWKEEKERLLSLSRAERRKELDKHYIPLDTIPTLLDEMIKGANDDENQEVNSLCEKVSLYKGDITQLEVDVIVNAANASLLGGGGVDGCIHRASGSHLYEECRMLGGCATGQAKMTCGYKLPAKYVIHTVGPIARGQLSQRHEEDLASCYKSSLALAKEHKIRSIAFPCISTGIYGFPNEPAAKIALETTKEWLKLNRDEIDRIIFCVFLEIDYKIYKKKLTEFFPKEGGDDDEKDDIKQDNKETDKETTATEEDLKYPVQESGETGCTEVTKESASVSEDTPEIKDPAPDSEKSEKSAPLLTVLDVTPMDISLEKEDTSEEGLRTEEIVSHESQVAKNENRRVEEIRTEVEMSTESQEQSENIPKKEDSISKLTEDEPNDSNHDNQETNDTTNDTPRNLESELASDDVHMLSQNIDSQHEDPEGNIAETEK